jgi:hypothetical protein
MARETPALLGQTFADSRHGNGKPTDRDWMTPLAFAALADNLELVRAFIGMGADRLAPAPGGRTLRDFVLERAGPDMCALFAPA